MRKTKRKSLIDAAGEVRELTAADLRSFKAANTALPAELQVTLGMRSRGPQKAPTKVSTTIRLSSDVVQAFRATGDGLGAAHQSWHGAHATGSACPGADAARPTARSSPGADRAGSHTDRSGKRAH